MPSWARYVPMAVAFAMPIAAGIRQGDFIGVLAFYLIFEFILRSAKQ